MNKTDRGALALAKAVEAAYAKGETDYYLEPMARVDENGKPVGKIENGDSVIFCCRRGEREIELTEAFTDPDFSRFGRDYMDKLNFVIMTMYHEKFKHLPIVFAPEKVKIPLAQVISEAGLRQFHCAESEKFAHVTFFFNGGENKPFEGETDVCVPSPKGIPFDRKPELSLPGVCEKVRGAISEEYDFIVVNFANGDVIGHTANSEAKIEAAHVVSEHVRDLVDYAKENGYIAAVTADHGNIETLYTEAGKPHGAHTANLVPFILIDPEGREAKLRDGRLGDVAPTLLKLLNIEKPAGMSGESLLTGEITGKKVMLVILDGWGYGSGDDNDAIWLAETSAWDSLLAEYPGCRLRASGEDVGLQAGKPGNSEAGHTNLGAGRMVAQDDVRMDAAIKSGDFRRNPVFLEAIRRAKDSGRALHLIAYLTKKSSHGCIDYPLMLTEMAEGVEKVYLHIIFDGRSTPPGSAPQLLAELEDRLNEIGRGEVVDGVGRGVALDRDGNYEKIRRAYEAMVLGRGTQYQ